MESKQPGLYFIGEVVDVTGWLGGYNFQWAWASGFACAQALAARHADAGGMIRGIAVFQTAIILGFASKPAPGLILIRSM